MIMLRGGNPRGPCVFVAEAVSTNVAVSVGDGVSQDEGVSAVALVEDGEAVMVFYAEDAVVENHPTVGGALATGKSEILVIEASLDGYAEALDAAAAAMDAANSPAT